MSVTFAVSDVKMGKHQVQTMELKTALKELCSAKFEAVGGPEKITRSIGSANGFVQAVHHAFDQHLPLALSPDHVWLMIEKTFAQHVTQNAEKLRDRIVTFQGKKELIVRRDGFRKGDPSNDWQGCFAEFSEQIKEDVGPLQKLTVCNFSTTGEIEKAASEVILMDAMSEYFSYTVRTLCGIPTISLLGVSKDWEDIYNRAQVLTEYDLGWWANSLLPVLDQFVKAAHGMPDREWWQSFYKQWSGSGGDTITGHILAFLPDLVKQKVPEKRTSGTLPCAVSKVPFIWDLFGVEIKMQLVAGMPFITTSPEGVVQPAVCWGVRER